MENLVIFWLPLRTLLFAEQIGNGRPLGTPKVPIVAQLFNEVLPRVPSGEVLGAASEKTSNNYDFRVPRNLEQLNIAIEGHQFSLFPPDPENAPNIPPTCSLLGTFRAPWAPQHRFWAV